SLRVIGIRFAAGSLRDVRELLQRGAHITSWCREQNLRANERRFVPRLRFAQCIGESLEHTACALKLPHARPFAEKSVEHVRMKRRCLNKLLHRGWLFRASRV